MHSYCAKINELNGFSIIEKKIVNMFWELQNGPLREAHLLRRMARDYGNRGTGLYGLRRHGGAGMGIHDEGKWQLR